MHSSEFLAETRMTALLEKAIAELQKLPPDRQDQMASLILSELADEAHWDRQFAASQDALSRLAAKVRQDIRQGKVKQIGIDEL
jgi:predicted amidophosphoribosyltransferase